MVCLARKKKRIGFRYTGKIYFSNENVRNSILIRTGDYNPFERSWNEGSPSKATLIHIQNKYRKPSDELPVEGFKKETVLQCEQISVKR